MLQLAMEEGQGLGGGEVARSHASEKSLAPRVATGLGRLEGIQRGIDLVELVPDRRIGDAELLFKLREVSTGSKKGKHERRLIGAQPGKQGGGKMPPQDEATVQAGALSDFQFTTTGRTFLEGFHIPSRENYIQIEHLFQVVNYFI
jgi:hypothetical protein